MDNDRLKPLVVRCQARSGSTFLMRCLSQLDGIAVALHPPCEVRYAQYMSATFDVVTGEADHEDSSRPNFFHREKGEKWIGRNPFNRRLSRGYHQYFDNDYAEDFRRFFDQKVQGFYQLVAQTNKVSAEYFCEKTFYISQKGAQQDPDVIFKLYPHGVSAIYLVRDPRDIFCSNRAFFHSEVEQTEEMRKKAMTGLSRHMDAMAESYRKSENERKCIVRYEDLMREPEPVLAEVADFLGLEAQPGNLKSALAFARNAGSSRHKTSVNPAASVGRWRAELSEGMQAHAAKYFAKYCKTFGYT